MERLTEILPCVIFSVSLWIILCRICGVESLSKFSLAPLLIFISTIIRDFALSDKEAGLLTIMKWTVQELFVVGAVLHLCTIVRLSKYSHLEIFVFVVVIRIILMIIGKLKSQYDTTDENLPVIEAVVEEMPPVKISKPVLLIRLLIAGILSTVLYSRWKRRSKRAFVSMEDRQSDFHWVNTKFIDIGPLI